MRTVPFASLQYLEQNVTRLETERAIARVDKGACPYTSPTVLALKNGIFQINVDYINLNVQTENYFLSLMLIS